MRGDKPARISEVVSPHQEAVPVEAKAYPLQQVLSLDRRFVVPTYQRDYEWTRDGQWQLLFDDLEHRAERLGEARDRARAAGQDVVKADKAVGPHFLGAIVLDQLPSPTGSIDVRAVIDGQQRLTTLQLLIRGILDALTEGGSQRGKQLLRMILNPEDVGQGDDRYKLWPRRRDRDAWRIAMAPVCELASGQIYLEARKYFAQRARTFIGAGGADEQSSILVDAVLGLLHLVVIDLEDNDDAQVIFEVLNGRQTPLSAADLVKNLLFLRAELADGDQLDHLYAKYWSDFDDPWWKREVGRGHAARRHSDMLLAAWLTAARGEESTAGRLYSEIRSFLDDKPDVVGVLAEISSYAREYRVINAREPEPDSRVRAAYGRLALLAVTTTQPLLLWLRAIRVAGRISDEEHRGAVLAVESFVIRRMLIGAQTRGYGRVFAQALAGVQKRFGKDGADVSVLVQDELRKKPQGAHWPSDDEVIAACGGRRFYGVDSQERIRLLLSAIDERLRLANPKIEDITLDYHALTIEHIMPQEWRHHWPVDGANELERDVAAQRRDVQVNRLGNLTLVTKALNPALSNAGWVDKRPEIVKNSVLAINAEVAAHDDWDEESIDQRSRRLGEVACAIWARPTVVSDAEIPDASGRKMRAGAAFDWALVDAAVEEIPTGYWASYGDLAELASTSPQSVGSRLSGPSALPHAYRVLDRLGRISADFRWPDTEDTRDPRHVLEEDGITFDADRADPSRRLSQYAIAQLVPTFFSEEELDRLARAEEQHAKASASNGEAPWMVDGRGWHLWQVCSEKTRPIAEAITSLIERTAPGVSGPIWKKRYVVWCVGSQRWALLRTGRSAIRLRLRISTLGPAVIAKRLNAVLIAPGERASIAASGPIQVIAGRSWPVIVSIREPSDVAGDALDRLAAVLADEWSAVPWLSGESEPADNQADDTLDDEEDNDEESADDADEA